MNLDITLCKGTDCIYRDNCKRYIGYLYIKNHKNIKGYHSYFNTVPYDKFLEICNYLYWID